MARDRLGDLRGAGSPVSLRAGSVGPVAVGRGYPRLRRAVASRSRVCGGVCIPGIGLLRMAQPVPRVDAGADADKAITSVTLSSAIVTQGGGLYEPIKTFAESRPIMGVCAGMIMMAGEVDDDRVIPLGLMPFKAIRNFYGRQVHSFTADVKLSFDRDTFKAPFIRAPGIEKLSPKIEILATYDDNAVMIGFDKHIALSFHPELTRDTRIHEYWLNKLK